MCLSGASNEVDAERNEELTKIKLMQKSRILVYIICIIE
jgi:hypothetical protein